MAKSSIPCNSLKYEEIECKGIAITGSGSAGYYSAGLNLHIPIGYKAIGYYWNGDYATGIVPVIYANGGMLAFTAQKIFTFPADSTMKLTVIYAKK